MPAKPAPKRFRFADHLEKKSAGPGPFEVELSDGTVVTFLDPKSIHYSQIALLDSQNVDDKMRVLLGEDYSNFADHEDATLGFIEAVFEAWAEHYSLAAPGESAASSV